MALLIIITNSIFISSGFKLMNKWYSKSSPELPLYMKQQKILAFIRNHIFSLQCGLQKCTNDSQLNHRSSATRISGNIFISKFHCELKCLVLWDLSI